MKQRLENLLTVKSIVTILLTLAFIYLAIVGVISGDNLVNIFSIVIAFYFGTQANKEGV